MLEPLGDMDDPIEAELFTLEFTTLVAHYPAEVVVQQILPDIEAVASPQALLLFTAMSQLVPPPLDTMAYRAARRLRARHVRLPDWAASLGVPPSVRTCSAQVDEATGEPVLLTAQFDRGAAAHVITVLIDPRVGRAAMQIGIHDPADLADIVAELHDTGRRHALTLVETPMTDVAFRHAAEIALDARAARDRANPADADDEHADDYLAAARLLRTRLDTIRPRTDLARPAGRRRPAATLQLRVDIDGAKPPIWRRLEVPGDIPLRRLHGVLQTAFGWDGRHMYLFETEYGRFGAEDTGPAIQPDHDVTLEQVIAGGPVRYVYDFGDNWVHSITVEQTRPVAARNPQARCTGGRRAAPPEDCGGIGGYRHLLEALADPAHDDHHDMIEWLGLATADEFRPAAFSVRAVDATLNR